MVSPPLMPMFLKPQSSDLEQLGNLEPLEIEVDNFRNELHGLNATIFRRDSLSLNPVSLGRENPDVPTIDELLDVYPALKYIKEQPKNPVVDWKKGSQFKIPAQLTPPNSVRRGALGQKLDGSFMEIQLDMPDPEEISDKDIDSYFREMEPFVAKVNDAIKHEPFNERRLVRKIEQPSLVFEKPAGPWEASNTDNKELKEYLDDCFLAEIQKDYVSRYPWPITVEEEKALTWVPWAPYEFSMKKVDQRFEIEVDEALLRAMLAPPEPLDLRTLLRENAAERLSNESDSGDELELGNFPNPNGLSMLTKKRKLLLSEKVTQKASGIPSRSDQKRYEVPVAVEAHFSTLGLDLLDDPANAIKRLKLGYGFSESVMPTEPCMPLIQDKTWMDAAEDESSPGPMLQTPDHQQGGSAETIHEQHICLRLKPASFVVSTIITKQRRFFRRISQAYPSAVFIERDFNPMAAEVQQKNTEAYSDVTDGGFEADLVLSPTTGLLLTSVQRLQQRPLPGQNRLPQLHARLVNIASRYECLYLLVTHSRPNRTSDPPLDSSAALAISETMSFTQSPYFQDLQTNICVIPCFGEEQDLIQWIVCLMDKHSVQLHGIALTQEETLWEVWLRRAGLNPFAAQVALLVSASSPASERQPRNPALALPIFVAMDHLERMSRFSSILGKNILHRFNIALSILWS